MWWWAYYSTLLQLETAKMFKRPHPLCQKCHPIEWAEGKSFISAIPKKKSFLKPDSGMLEIRKLLRVKGFQSLSAMHPKRFAPQQDPLHPREDESNVTEDLEDRNEANLRVRESKGTWRGLHLMSSAMKCHNHSRLLALCGSRSAYKEVFFYIKALAFIPLSIWISNEEWWWMR